MRYTPISSDLFINNRKRFVKKLKDNSLAVFNSNDIMPTNADGTMPFRQNNDLFYLSGIDQEESVLLIFPDANEDKHREILFLKETSELIATWEGDKLTKEQATELSGIKTVYWLDQLDSVLEALMMEAEFIYLNSNEHKRAAKEVETREERFLKKMKEKYPLHKYERSAPIMHQLRAIKSETEIEVMKHACSITEKGFRRLLEFIKPGVMEYEIEAELLAEFIRNRSRGFAYEPIIASGESACVLHYIANNKQCKDGDLILMDIGAEYANYASDLTRCVPVNGKFSDRQKEVYNAVLRVQKEAIKMLRVGTYLKEYEKEVGKMVEKELIGLGLLDETDIKNQDPEKPLYKKYFMHGTSHFIGLDVHDVGDFNKPLHEGMTFTCEPGIYIREEGIGVRIENDVVVSEDEPLDLMKTIPREVEEIEELMNA